MLCLGLSGIGVGLGARLPVITEQSPSRIAAGFGGTLNLVISTLFIVLVLALATLPCHVYLARQAESTFSFGGDSPLADRRPFLADPWLAGQSRRRRAGRAAAHVDRHTHLSPAGVPLTKKNNRRGGLVRDGLI